MDSKHRNGDEKNMKKPIFYLSLAFVIFASLIYLAIIRNTVSEQSNHYEYKITPNDAEWKNFKTHDEMVAACRIPSEIVKKMTTEQLVNAVMDYPLLIDLLAFNSNEEGIQALLGNSDAFKELTTRTDSKKYLLKKLFYLTEKNLPEDSINIKMIKILMTEESISN
jgi:hypothetical protein